MLLAREHWADILDRGEKLDSVYVDFSKAFDKVPHHHLLSKLAAYGIEGNLLLWLKDFLVGRSMKVQVNTTYSESVECTSGVPQGSVLGPQLFKVFINDLPETLGLPCLLYADDLKLWLPISSETDVDTLQEALDALHSWCTSWELPVNQDKCSVLPIGSGQPTGVYHLGGILLKDLTAEKDLGIVVTPNMKTSQESFRRIKSASGLLWGIRRSFDQLTPDIFWKVFCSHIRPILEYGQPAFYPLLKQESDALERVQRRGSKMVRGFRNVEYLVRLKRLNLFPLDYRRARGDLIYTQRIIRGELGPELNNVFGLSDTSTRGHNLKLRKPRRLRLSNLTTLSTRVINRWNNLPADVAEAGTEVEFKRKLDNLQK